MYAIIRAGGKQAKVREGDVLDVERIKSSGEEISFRPLLVVTDDGTVISERGALDKAKVVASVEGEVRGEKLTVFKYKAKTGYRQNAGHRQTYTRIKVTKIEAPGAKKKTKASSKKSPAKAEAEAAEDKAAESAEVDATQEA